MDNVTFCVWMAGILAVIGILVALLVWKSLKPPLDPEEKLRLLIGPSGMAPRDRNRAALKAKQDPEYIRENLGVNKPNS